MVWAYLLHLKKRAPGEAEQREMHARMRVMVHVHHLARKLGHDPVTLRAEKGQAALACRTCHARAYGDSREEPPIIDGPLVEDECEERED
jgi:hypothetical protein